MKKFTFSISLLFLAAFFLKAQNYNMALRSTLSWSGQRLANIAGYWQNGQEYALVGASQGLIIVDITDPDNPQQIVQIPGPNNNWKEIKTYGHHAYITSEGGQGVQIVDLSNLPNSNLSHKYYKGTGTLNNQLDRIHALHIDTTLGFLYCFGGNQQGATIHALNPDPYNPTFVGDYLFNGYIHDGYVDNDTLYACHIYDGDVLMVDMTNKQNPQVLGGVKTPNEFPHNAWILPDRQHVLTTDERPNSYLACYNVSDPTDIYETDRMQMTPGSGSVVHNTHVMGHFAVSSWYRDGLNIVDAFRPNNLVQVGAYDTYPQASGSGYNGCWGAYPFFPSGTIIASNIDPAQLFIFTPDYKQACYVEGKITDACTGLDVQNVDIGINHTDPLFATKTDPNGIFRTGQPTAGDFTVTLSKAGYITRTFDVELKPHQVVQLDVQLYPNGTATTLPPFQLCEGESVMVCGNAYAQAGSYAAVCPTGGSCDSTVFFDIQITNVYAEIQGGNTIDCLNPSLTLSSVNSIGTPTWLDGNGSALGNGQTQMVNQGGMYVLEVTAGLGCSDVDTIFIQANTTPPNLTAQGGTIDCANPSITLQANSTTPNVSIFWQDNQGNTTQGQTLTTSQTGTYTATATDPFNGCTNTATVSVLGSSMQPDVQTSVSNVLDCAAGNATVSAFSSFGNVTYAWFGPNGFSASGASFQTDQAGVYTVTVTSVNGCSSVASVEVLEDAQVPDISVSNSNAISCENSTSMLWASSSMGISYAWSGPNGFAMAAQTILVSEAGAYTATVTSPNGCTNTASVTVLADFAIPDITVVSGTLTCANTSVTVSATSSVSNAGFIWGTPSGTPTVNAPGTYNVTVTNPANGCSTTTTFDVSLDVNTPTVSVSGGTITCTNPSVDLVASSSTPNAVFNWSNGATGAVASVSNPGDYVVTVTDPMNGCTVTASAVVTADLDAPTFTVSQGPVLDCDNDTEPYVATPAFYPYEWYLDGNFVGTGSTVTVGEGLLLAIATNQGNGCTTELETVVMPEDDIPVISLPAPDTLNCLVDEVQLQLESSSILSSVEWSGSNGYSSSEVQPTISQAGLYTVTVTSAAEGCTSEGSVVVIEDVMPPLASIIPLNVPSCSTTSDTFLAQPPNMVYEWTVNGIFAGTNNTVAVSDGSLTVVVTDPSNGCSASTQIIVPTDIDIPDAEILPHGNLSCCNSEVELTMVVQTPNTEYGWYDDNGALITPELTTIVNQPGAYFAIVTDTANGCYVNLYTAVLIDTEAPSITATGGTITCDMPTVTLQSETDAQNASFAWSGPNNFNSNLQNPMVDSAGSYLVAVTDLDNCCTATASVVVLDSCLVSVATLEKSKHLQVFPNPSNGLISLQSNTSDFPIEQYAVFDEKGQLVLENTATNNLFEKIDLQHQADGVYVLRVFSDGTWWSARVILQR